MVLLPTSSNMELIVLLVIVFIVRCESNQENGKENTSDKDSFHVVRAIYGIHPENRTDFPVYRKAKNLTQDQETQASEVKPKSSISYQVHESGLEQKISKVQGGHPTLHEIHNVISDIEERDPANYPGIGTRLIEVVRVPAVYEMHLQSDQMGNVLALNPWMNSIFPETTGFSPQPLVYRTNYNGQPVKPRKPFGHYKQSFAPINEYGRHINQELYGQPQAIHEVPAPVLNRPLKTYNSYLQPQVNHGLLNQASWFNRGSLDNLRLRPVSSYALAYNKEEELPNYNSDYNPHPQFSEIINPPGAYLQQPGIRLAGKKPFGPIVVPNEDTFSYGSKRSGRRQINFPRPFNINKRPMDYILYIKEHTYE